MLDAVGCAHHHSYRWTERRTRGTWLGRWQEREQADVEQRLQELYQPVVAIIEAFSPSVPVAFLRGTNPHLGDRAPLVVLADSDPSDAGPALMKATRALIEE